MLQHRNPHHVFLLQCIVGVDIDLIDFDVHLPELRQCDFDLQQTFITQRTPFPHIIIQYQHNYSPVFNFDNIVFTSEWSISDVMMPSAIALAMSAASIPNEIASW